MRIKKKNVLKESYIINEAILLDQLSHIKPNVKKVLKLIKKKFLPKELNSFHWWSLSRYDIQEFLENEMSIPEIESYKIASFFIKYGEKLFSESESYVYDLPLKKVFGEMFTKYIRKFIKEKHNYPDLLFKTKINGKEYVWDEYEIWDSYAGFSIYLSYNFAIETSIVINFFFDTEKGDENTILIKESTLRYDGVDGVERIPFIANNTEIDLPKEETYESFVEWMQELITNSQTIFNNSKYRLKIK